MCVPRVVVNTYYLFFSSMKSETFTKLCWRTTKIFLDLIPSKLTCVYGAGNCIHVHSFMWLFLHRKRFIEPENQQVVKRLIAEVNTLNSKIPIIQVRGN